MTPKTVLAALALVAPVFSQATKTAVVIPPHYANLEGNTKHTYPFGRDTAAIQILIHGDQIASRTALIRTLQFRPDAPFDGYSAYSKKYNVDLWPTTVTANQMGTDATANQGKTTKTNVFNASLSLPKVAAQVQAPGSFDLTIPFTRPYSLDVTKANLLLQVDTADTTIASKWDLDAVTTFDNKLRGENVRIGERCIYVPPGTTNTYALSLGLSTNTYVGGTAEVTLRNQGGAPSGTWPTAILAFDTQTSKPFDMTSLGMPKCFLHIAPTQTAVITETNGSYPKFTRSIPSTNSLAGFSFVLQALGGKPNTLRGAVTTDAYQVVLGPSQTPARRNQQSIFNSRGRWFISGIAAYAPVVRFTGVFQ